MFKEHEALKEIAIKILSDMGYLPNEIQKEYWVRPYSSFGTENKSLHGCRVDVVGINANKRVAIECGKTSGEKIAALKIFFDEVIVLPYFSLNLEKLDLERVIREKNEAIVERDKTIKQLEGELSDRHFFDRTIQEITRAWMEVVHRSYASHHFLYYDFEYKTDTQVMEELSIKVNELKETIRNREEQERIKRGLDKTQLATVSIIPK